MGKCERESAAAPASSAPAAPPKGPQEDNAGIPQPVRITLLVLISAATVAAVWIVAGRVWRIGIPGEWQWTYYDEPGSWVLASPALVLALFLAITVAAYLRRRVQRAAHQAVAVCLALALALGIILSLGSAGPLGALEPVYVTANPWVGGYDSLALEIGDDLTGFLGKYPDLMKGWPLKGHPFSHLSDHPAGPVVFHWAVNRTVGSSPALVRLFTPDDPEERQGLRVWAERNAKRRISDSEFAGIGASALLFRMGYWLALVPIYFLARDLHSRKVALIAVALAALIPSLHLFGPYPDQFLALFAAGAVYTWYRAARGRNMAWAALSAVIMLVGLQFSLSLLAAGGIMGLASFLMMWEERSAKKRIGWSAWLRVGLTWVATFLISSLLLRLLLGYDTWSVWSVCLAKHGTFAAEFNRSYLSWVLFNPVEFLLFTGVPISLLLAYAAADDFRRGWSSKGAGVPALLPWSLLGVLLLLNVSGKSLGETARLWMFMMPFAAVSAAAVLSRLDRGEGWVASYVLLLAAIQLIVFRLNLFVFSVV